MTEDSNDSSRIEPLDSTACRFISRAGFGNPIAAKTLSGGKNNKVFRISADDGSSVVLKIYYHHPRDPRDRLAHEFTFSTYAWSSGLRCLPKPLAQDPTCHYGLYEYVPGRRLEEAEITREVVESAATFVSRLNQYKASDKAASLPSGSEACFSIAEHLETVERRVQLLAVAGDTGKLPNVAKEFIRRRLLPDWNAVRERIVASCGAQNIGLEKSLSAENRVISPSDFGYHNAIFRDGEAGPESKVCYHDFEYAGWDDPAKLLGDFFNQPEVPVPAAFYGPFAERCLSLCPNPELQFDRAGILHPAYTIKWTCIILNAVIPDGRARRDFAGHESSDPALAERQVARASATLGRLDNKVI